MDTPDSQDTLADVGKLIRERGAELRTIVHERLFEAIPEAHNLFPDDPARTHVELPRALAWVLERSRIDESLPAELTERLRQLGKDHRRHGFPPDTYDLFGLLLGDAIAEVVGDDLPQKRVNASMVVVGHVCSQMRDGATRADELGVPPAHAAQVTGVETASRGVKVVQLEAGMPVEYSAGQQVPVMPMQRRGEWLNLAPAVPPNRFGQVELHVPADIPAEKGEYWTLGAPRGGVTIDPRRNALVVGIGTGVAAVKALVFDLLEQNKQPKVHVVLAAHRPADLYEVSTFTALASSQDWLTVTAVVEQGATSSDTTTEQSATTSFNGAREAGITPVSLPVSTVVSGVGMFWGRQIVLCGNEEDTTAVHAALREAGALESDIQVVTPSGPDRWPEPSN